MQYIVTQSPKGKYADSNVTVMMIVEADNAAAAIRIAKEADKNGDKWFTPNMYYSLPVAAPLELKAVYTF